VRIAIVVGTRPEIIKMAPLVRACARRELPYLLLHTGQHYSFRLDGVFFEELELPRPGRNLEVGSGTQAYQIAAIVSGMEKLLLEERPDVLLVEGDTNSVLASALAAHKLGIRVGHVEAGLRSFDRSMPEEINRVLTDHLSDLLFAPTPRSLQTLLTEGVPRERVHLTGNPVVDELTRQRPRAERPGLLERVGVAPRGYALATVHRLENVEDEPRLRGIFAGIAAAARDLSLPVIAALHPRTTARLEALGLEPAEPIRAVPPLGYLDFLGLLGSAALALTDSGGVQEEACCLGAPCVTLRDNTERPESIEVGANRLAGADPERIVAAARVMVERRGGWENPFGDGKSGERIIELLAG
jgi:UDP-N-acetylglucosamine 2-epimerase (non-hydrolysing)